MFKRLYLTLLVMLLAMGVAVAPTALAQEDMPDPDAERIVTIVAASEPFLPFTTEYPDYGYYAERDGEFWYIELFYVDGEEEIWFGEALIHAETLEFDYVYTAEGEGEEDVPPSPEALAAVDFVKADPDFATLLAMHPNYQTEIFQEGNAVFVAFFIDTDEAFIPLGEAFIDINTLEFYEKQVPVFLTPEQIAAQTPQIVQFAQNSPVVQELVAGLSDPNQQPDVEYDPSGGWWLLFYEDGLDIYMVAIGESNHREEDGVLIVWEIRNVSEFDEAERDRIERDQAITIAFNAEIFETLDLGDDWMARANPLGEGLVGVDFITTDGTLIVQIIVDLPSEMVREVVTP